VCWQFCMATSKSEDRQLGGDWRAGDDVYKHKLTTRQETLRRFPRSDDMNETTVTALDGRPVTGSRLPSGTRPADQLPLPTVSVPTSSDDMWSNVSPANDNDTSSVKSDSRPPSAAVPARLPALNICQSSKNDFKTVVENDTPRAAHELGSVESIRMEGGSHSGKLANIDGASAWSRETIDNKTERPLEAIPPEAAKDGNDDHEDRRETESTNYEAASSEHVDNTQTSTSTNSAQHDEEVELAKTVHDDTDVVRTHEDDVAVPAENIQTYEDSSPNELREQPKDMEVETAEEQSQVPGENDSGVNVEDVHNDEPTTAEQDITQVPETTSAVPATETRPVDTMSSHDGDRNSLNVTPSNDYSMLSPSKQLNTRGQFGDLDDGDRLSIPKSPNETNSGHRRNSSLDARDSKQLRHSDEGLARNTDQNKPRLLALAQKGEWSVLDQILRAMERSSFYEVNLADEV